MELDIRITWENDAFFKLESKREGEDWKSIVYHEENGFIGELWHGIQKVGIAYLTKELEIIGTEMKVE